MIYSPRSRPSARIERWVLRLQPYDFSVCHIPGKSNIADALSRLTVSNQGGSDRDEEAIRLIVEGSAPCAMSIQEIEAASAIDSELRTVRECVQLAAWENLPDAYRNVRMELSVLGQLVLRGQRIVMPTDLRRQTLKLAHEGHQGIVKVKERLRSKVWWPGMDKEAEKFCRSCHACQVVGQPAVTSFCQIDSLAHFTVASTCCGSTGTSPIWRSSSCYC